MIYLSMKNNIYLRLASLYKISYESEIKDDIFYFKGFFKDMKFDSLYYITAYDKYYYGFGLKERLESEFIEKFYNELKKIDARNFVKTLNKKQQKLILRHL